MNRWDAAGSPHLEYLAYDLPAVGEFVEQHVICSEVLRIFVDLKLYHRRISGDIDQLILTGCCDLGLVGMFCFSLLILPNHSSTVTFLIPSPC